MKLEEWARGRAGSWEVGVDFMSECSSLAFQGDKSGEGANKKNRGKCREPPKEQGWGSKGDREFASGTVKWETSAKQSREMEKPTFSRDLCHRWVSPEPALLLGDTG